MQIQKSFKGQSPYGKLYLVATPIGNLDDMTFRAIQTLKEVDWIAAEDTRNTGFLLKHFDISTKQISFHEHNAKEKIPDLIEFLKAGQSIAQVSDAGLPSISDPGHDLVKAAIEEEIAVVTVPGASAGISALIASGLAPQPGPASQLARALRSLRCPPHRRCLWFWCARPGPAAHGHRR